MRTEELRLPIVGDEVEIVNHFGVKQGIVTNVKRKGYFYYIQYESSQFEGRYLATIAPEMDKDSAERLSDRPNHTVAGFPSTDVFVPANFKKWHFDKQVKCIDEILKERIESLRSA